MGSLIMVAAAASSTANPDFAGFLFDQKGGQKIALVVYIVASLVAVGIAIARRSDFKGVLTDKSTLATTGGTTDTAPTSFSRLAGLLGLLYLTAFFWGLGFFVLTYIWVDPVEIGKVVSACGQFLMAGSALFAPYAFNQLSQVFSGKGGDSTLQVTPANLTPAVIDKSLTPRG